MPMAILGSIRLAPAPPPRQRGLVGLFVASGGAGLLSSVLCAAWRGRTFPRPSPRRGRRCCGRGSAGRSRMPDFRADRARLGPPWRPASPLRTMRGIAQRPRFRTTDRPRSPAAIAGQRVASSRLPRAAPRASPTSRRTSAAARTAAASRSSRRAPGRASTAGVSRPDGRPCSTRTRRPCRCAAGCMRPSRGTPHVPSVDSPSLVPGGIVEVRLDGGRRAIQALVDLGD